jgi:hypothetical protein
MNSPAMIDAHHKGLPTKAEAAKWVAGLPSKPALNVIQPPLQPMFGDMKYSPREKFFWLKSAALLDKTDLIVESLGQLDHERQEKFSAGETPKELLAKLHEKTTKEYAKEISQAIASNPSQIRDYCKVRQSMNRARTILICLCRGEVSIDDLDRKGNEKGQISQRGFRIDEKKVALRSAGISGSLKNYSVGIAMATARQQNDLKYLKKLIKAAESKKGPSKNDYDRVSIVARFLVHNWCGATGEYDMWIKALMTERIGDWCGKDGAFVWKDYQPVFFLPPLCFFKPKELANFCESALGKMPRDKDTTSPTHIRKWVSRLHLTRADTPKIQEVKVATDGIYLTYL